MKINRRTFLSLECLEERCTPATIQFVAGTLNISPSVGEPALTLLVMQTGANTFQVTDNGKNDGTYGPVSNVNITGGPGADSITFDVNGRNYTGNLTINSGNGPSFSTFDTVEITNSSGTAGGIGGNVSVMAGTGTPFVGVGYEDIGLLTIGGSVQLTNSPGNGRVFTGNGSAVTRIGGNLTISGFSDVEPGGGQADTVGGSLTITNPNTTVPVYLVIGDNLTVGKSLSISEGNGADSIAIGQMTVNGSTNVSVGSGSDLVGLGVYTGLGGTSATFNGPVSVTAGNGNDLVVTGPAVSIAGNLSLTVGSGTDSIQLSPVGLVPVSVTIFGSVNVTAGNGSNSVLVDAGIFGNLSFHLGNGNDTVTVVNAPFGTLNWISGNGNDSLTLGAATTAANSFWAVNLQFGTGNDSLTLDPTASPVQTLTGRVDGGGGMDSFINTGTNWTIGSPFSIGNGF